MAKYENALKSIESVFAADAWTSTGIEAFPANFKPTSFNEEFVKVEVLPGTPNTNYSQVGVGGLVIVQIYTKANTGPKRVMEIADFLDRILQTKKLNSHDLTVTSESTLNFLGIDQDDNSLYRADYSVRFNHYIT